MGLYEILPEPYGPNVHVLRAVLHFKKWKLLTFKREMVSYKHQVTTDARSIFVDFYMNLKVYRCDCQYINIL